MKFPIAQAMFDVVAIACSAGGIHALSVVLPQLPADFPAAVFVLQHLDPNHPSMLAEILNRYSKLPVTPAEDHSFFQGGHIYVAPPNQHLRLNQEGIMSLDQAKQVHFVRPSADLLFESMASVFKDRCIAVVLTGTGQDGSQGVREVSEMGGRVIAQDKETSDYFGMPGAAIDTGAVNYVLPLKIIGTAIVSLTMKGITP